MSKFKVGDWVRLTEKGRRFFSEQSDQFGQVIRVEAINLDGPIHIVTRPSYSILQCYDDEIEPVDPAAIPMLLLGE